MGALQEPERWLSADDDVAVRLRPALRMARGEGPNAGQLERLWGSLTAKLPAAAVESQTPPAAMSGESSTAVAAAVEAASGPGWWWVAGTGVVAAALGFSAATLMSRPFASTRHAVPAVAKESRTIERATVPTSIDPMSPSVSKPQAESAVESDIRSTERAAPSQIGPGLLPPEPASERTRSPKPVALSSGDAKPLRPSARLRPERRDQERSRVPLETVQIGTTVDLPAELDLLARARRIVASAPERALQLTAEHARRYQEGVLAQEREVLAIDALMRLGHRDLAATRARRFIERYPDSAHRVRLATELEAP